jgi:prepilin-type N-terminal cleavage/methylation domain-containing protein
MERRKPLEVRQKNGFTLIEIVGVLALLSIIALGAVSVLPGSDVSLPTEVDRLSSHLRYAQIRAQADTYQWRVVFNDTQTYQIGPVVVPGAGFTPTIVPGEGGTQRTLTGGVTATAGTAIRFDSWGRPMTDGGALLVEDQAITLTQGTQTQAVTIRAGTGLIP